jgi:signal transduction histidine kinase
MPAEIVPAVGENLSKEKSFYLYAFGNKCADEEYGQVSSVVLIQTKQPLGDKLATFLEDFCCGLCSRDALMQLFERQVSAHRCFKRHVVDARHDLNTAMHYFTGNLDKLIREFRKGATLDTQQGEENWARIRESIAYYRNTVSKLEAPEFTDVRGRAETIDIFDLVYKQAAFCEARAAEDKNICIDVSSLPREGAYILCDSIELAQAVLCILDNAIKYSYSGWKRSAGTDVTVTGRTEGDVVILTVENYGVGVPPGKLKEIREYGHRAAIHDRMRYRGGSGLGLTIAIEVIEKKLGGKITMDSRLPQDERPPGGKDTKYLGCLTTVTMTLPIVVKG